MLVIGEERDEGHHGYRDRHGSHAHLPLPLHYLLVLYYHVTCGGTGFTAPINPIFFPSIFLSPMPHLLHLSLVKVDTSPSFAMSTSPSPPLSLVLHHLCSLLPFSLISPSPPLHTTYAEEERVLREEKENAIIS